MPTFRATLRRVGLLYAVEVPVSVVTALGGAKKIPVIARYLDDAHASTVTSARGGSGRLFVRVDIFRPHGLGVGDKLDVSLTPDRSPRVLSVPTDLQRALQVRPAAAAAFTRAAPSTRRMVVELLESSRTEETRRRRLEKIIERLAENTANRATQI